MTPETLALALAAAIQFSGLPAIEAKNIPPVIAQSRAELAQSLCDLGTCNPSAMAAYDRVNERILIRSDLNLDGDLTDLSFLVHELTHKLQDAAGHKFDSCQSVLADEKAAFAVQNKFLRQNGQFYVAGIGLRFRHCDEDEKERGE